MNSFGRERLIRAAALVTGSTYITYTLGLLASAVIARSLGPSDFGRYAYLIWLSAMMVTLANHGLTTSAIRFISECTGRRDLHGASSVERQIGRWQWASIVVVVIVGLAMTPWLLPQGWSFGLPLFGILVSIAVVGKSAYLMNVSVAKGYGRFSLEAKVNASLAVANVVAVLALRYVESGLLSYVAWFSGISSAYWWWSAKLLRRGRDITAPTAPVEVGLHHRLMTHLRWTIVLVLLGGVAARSFETLLLNQYATAAAIAYFAVAAGLTRGGIELLTSGLQTVLMPAMSHAYGHGSKEAVIVILGSSIRYVTCLGLIAAGTGALLAEPAITILYGADYSPAIWVMKAIAIVAGLSLPEAVFGSYLSTTENQRARVHAYALSVAVSGTLAIAFIPSLGLAGAVLSYGGGRVTIVAYMAFLILVKERVAVDWSSLAGLLIAAGIAFGAASLLSNGVDGLAADAGAAALFLLMFAFLTSMLKTWRDEEYDLLLSQASRSRALDRTFGNLLRLTRCISDRVHTAFFRLARRLRKTGMMRRLAVLGGSSAVSVPLRSLHDRGHRSLLILAYHRVMPLPDPGRYPFDLELISASPEAFRDQMRHIRADCDPISITELVAHFTSGAPLPPRPALVTFDDGYVDNVFIAGPILREFGIVPTIFVSTNQVGATEPYWFEWLCYLMMRVPVGSIEVPELAASLPRESDWRTRRTDARTLQEAFKRLSIDAIHARIEDWKDRFSAVIDPADFALSATLDWQQIAERDGNGFHFESHGVSHGILSMMSDAELRSELVDSKSRLECALRRPVRALAYPVGKEFAYSPSVQAAAKDAGYALAASYVGGFNDIHDLERFALRRQNVERMHSFREFVSMSRFPRWLR